MLDELREYYKLNGISANSFRTKKGRCIYFEKCSYRKDFFITAKEAFVSTGYEAHLIPRLLIISLDPKPTNFYKSVNHRTLDAIRDNEEIHPKESYYSWGTNSHWRKTYDFIGMLLKRIITVNHPDELRHYFAHTNSAKCHDKEGNDKAGTELFSYCREYIYPEVIILDPDIVITQGNDAADSLRGKFPNRANLGIFKKYRDLQKVYPIFINNHNAIWIETNHPCRHDGKYLIEDWNNVDRYGELVYEFWKEYRYKSLFSE